MVFCFCLCFCFLFSSYIDLSRMVLFHRFATRMVSEVPKYQKVFSAVSSCATARMAMCIC
jgi:hypothetical protein